MCIPFGTNQDKVCFVQMHTAEFWNVLPSNVESFRDLFKRRKKKTGWCQVCIGKVDSSPAVFVVSAKSSPTWDWCLPCIQPTEEVDTENFALVLPWVGLYHSFFFFCSGQCLITACWWNKREPKRWFATATRRVWRCVCGEGVATSIVFCHTGLISHFVCRWYMSSPTDSFCIVGQQVLEMQNVWSGSVFWSSVRDAKAWRTPTSFAVRFAEK